jgi:hypothetical protein
MAGVLTLLQEAVDRRLDAGQPLDLVESEVVDTAPLEEEQRAALWLYAWHGAASGQRPWKREVVVRAHE